MKVHTTTKLTAVVIGQRHFQGKLNFYCIVFTDKLLGTYIQIADFTLRGLETSVPNLTSGIFNIGYA